MSGWARPGQMFTFGVRGEVSSAQPPQTEREGIVSIEENQEAALEKKAERYDLGTSQSRQRPS